MSCITLLFSSICGKFRKIRKKFEHVKLECLLDWDCVSQKRRQTRTDNCNTHQLLTCGSFWKMLKKKKLASISLVCCMVIDADGHTFGNRPIKCHYNFHINWNGIRSCGWSTANVTVKPRDWTWFQRVLSCLGRITSPGETPWGEMDILLHDTIGQISRVI